MTQDAALAFDVPDLIEPIEAWRAWRVVARDDRFVLGSIVQPTLWPCGRPLSAECLRPPPILPWFRRRRREESAVPDPECVCGIYAGKLEDIGRYLTRLPTSREAGRVLGQVHLWGTVIECERGFRAGQAYPSRIYVPADQTGDSGRNRNGATCDEIAAGLADYGVPVELVAGGRRDAVESLQRQPSS